jgi:hypothetical protein
MTPTQKAELLKQAIPPEHLDKLLIEGGLGRAVPKSAWTRGPWGRMGAPGIYADRATYGPDCLIPWPEIRAIAQAASAGGRRSAYVTALDEYWRWMESSGRGHLSEADKAERLVWRDRVSERLRETAWAIIDAGCVRYVTPEPLFEMGGAEL